MKHSFKGCVTRLVSIPKQSSQQAMHFIAALELDAVQLIHIGEPRSLLRKMVTHWSYDALKYPSKWWQR